MKEAAVISESFRALYGSDPAVCAFAPGRVNLIGEHTDYNGGHVFPCALERGTWCAARRRQDGVFRFWSANFPEAGVLSCTPEALSPGRTAVWSRYPEGVLWAFTQAGFPLRGGADFAFLGNVPAGAGLSSSASIEVAAAWALRALYGFSVSDVELARLCQRAENAYVGVSCGIMDQFASAMGRAGCGIFLDTEHLDYEYAPCDFPGAGLVICNSKVRHALDGSAYNRRRQECEQALSALRRVRPLDCLCALTPAEFARCEQAIDDPVCRARVRHAVTENHRTVLALAALKAGRAADFGALMNDSHVSLRDDFQVSCPELDLLTSIAWSVPGVLGSRMTGGGFGGCTITLVEDRARDDFLRRTREQYKRQTGLEPEFYDARIGGGARLTKGGEKA